MINTIHYFVYQGQNQNFSALNNQKDFSQQNDNVLILNKKINDDGTVKLLNKSDDLNSINSIIDEKLSHLLEKKMTQMLEKKIPIILDNYFKNRK